MESVELIEMLAAAIHACSTGVTSAATGGTAGSASLPLGVAVGALGAYFIAAAILTIGILIVTGVAVLARPRAPAALAIPIGATFSPDGYYWWDGGTWRPVSRS